MIIYIYMCCINDGIHDYYRSLYMDYKSHLYAYQFSNTRNIPLAEFNSVHKSAQPICSKGIRTYSHDYSMAQRLRFTTLSAEKTFWSNRIVCTKKVIKCKKINFLATFISYPEGRGR